ncbi:MAG: hypothetical protein FD155_1761 [Bacteroidetes bacterium]|nr:MAG: hypothetical protein FD155_1761 [Bacteroidota bacterium]
MRSSFVQSKQSTNPVFFDLIKIWIKNQVSIFDICHLRIYQFIKLAQLSLNLIFPFVHYNLIYASSFIFLIGKNKFDIILHFNIKILVGVSQIDRCL